MLTLLALAFCLLAAAGIWLAFLLVRQGGRILVRLDALERELVILRLRDIGAPESPDRQSSDPVDSNLLRSRINRNGLEPEAPAPEFRLSRVDGGGSVALSDYRGRPLLLILASADCDPCDVLFGRLAQLAVAGAADSILVVSRGDPQTNLEKLGHYRPVFPVVLQEGWEVSRLYETFKFPSAYVINADGLVVSKPAIGPDAAWDMARVFFCGRGYVPAVPRNVGVQVQGG